MTAFQRGKSRASVTCPSEFESHHGYLFCWIIFGLGGTLGLQSPICKMGTCPLEGFNWDHLLKLSTAWHIEYPLVAHSVEVL